MIDAKQKRASIDAGGNTNIVTARYRLPEVNAALGHISLDSGSMSDAVTYDFLEWVSGEKVQWSDTTNVIFKVR